MKILLSANTSWYIWNFRLSLIKELQSCGHTVGVVASKDSYSDRFTAEGISFHPILINSKSINPFGEIFIFLSYFFRYLKEKPDVVLQYTIKPNLYGSIAARILHLHVINNVSGLGSAFEKNNYLTTLVVWLYKIAFKKAHTIFFQNLDDQNLFIDNKIINKQKIGLLPGSGVNLSLFYPKSMRSNVFTFLFVGRMLKAKGVEDFIKAAIILRQRNINPIRFVMIGTHDPSDIHMADQNLINKAVSDKIIEIHGQVDDVLSYIHQADCVVLPSYYREGVPRSLLEAAACGKPIIAADSIGTREPVIHGENGFLCKPANVDDLTEVMSKMVNLPRTELDEMGVKSRQIAEERFDEQIVISAYLDVLDVIKI